MQGDDPNPVRSRTARGSVPLVAVVVTYNRLSQLQVTLPRLLDVPADTLAGIVVIDNASTDGTAGWLAEQEDWRLRVLRSPVNTGGAGGFESGLRAALEAFDFRWVVVMDDDARPMPGALERFAARLPADQDAVAAAVFYPDGRICEMNRPSLNPFWRGDVLVQSLKGALAGHLRDGFHVDPAAYRGAERVEIDGASFVGLFLSRRVLEIAGLPDGGLFLYGDDTLYTLGLHRHGMRIAFDPCIRFEHDCSTFAGDQIVVLRPLWKVYYRCRNGLMVYRLASGWLFWLALPLLVMRWRLGARRYGADRRLYKRLLWRSIIDGLTGKTDRDHAEVLRMAAEAPSRP